MNATIRFRASKKLKVAAQKAVKRLGISFAAAMNEKLREFVERQEITFSLKGSHGNF